VLLCVLDRSGVTRVYPLKQLSRTAQVPRLHPRWPLFSYQVFFPMKALFYKAFVLWWRCWAKNDQDKTCGCLAKIVGVRVVNGAAPTLLLPVPPQATSSETDMSSSPFASLTN
jgi:hypothetical protein